MKEYRTQDQIDDILLPEGDSVPQDVRCRAIIDVLCRIPDLDYRRLVERFQKIEWFVPDAGDLSCFSFFDANIDITMEVGGSPCPPGKLALIIYLSPALEQEPLDLVQCVVAEKLAHVILGHEKFVRLDDESEAREKKERLSKLQHWGFPIHFKCCMITCFT